MSFFPGFDLRRVDIPGGHLRVRTAGSGPPLLLLHGNPQTHAMWHRVAPKLAERYSVVCPDLRGYGQSHKPPATADHTPYAKREMAADMAALMTVLGHESFCVGSHDRGARVAHRLALDHADRVERLAVLDIVPTIEHFERTDMAFALGYYHWFWFAQPHPFPEKPDLRVARYLVALTHQPRTLRATDFFDPNASADYLKAVHDPEMIRGMCEDYRAAATIDLVHDRESRAAGEKVRCPMLVLWGGRGKIGQWYKPLDVWREYCSSTVSGSEVQSGHYIAEEAPTETLAAFEEFFA